MKIKILIIALFLFTIPAFAQEYIELDSAIKADAGAKVLRVSVFHFETFPAYRIIIGFQEWDPVGLTFVVGGKTDTMTIEGAEAEAWIKAANKKNFSLESVEKSVLKYAQGKGKFGTGVIKGQPLP